jgi:hypothetical protein
MCVCVFFPVRSIKAYVGSRSVASLFLNHNTGSRYYVVNYTPWPIYPWKEALYRIHWIGCWVGPRAGVDFLENSKIPFPFRD